MSLDFQYMTVVDSLAVSEIIDIADASPRTLKINGWNGYYTLQSIRINDVAINTFTVLSDKSVLVPLPTSLTTLPITDMLVELLSNSLSGTRRVRVLFTSTGNTKSVSGILKLLQQVLSDLTSRLQSNRWDPLTCGGLPDSLGGTINISNIAPLTAKVSQCLGKTQAAFLARQAKQSNLASDEKLAALTLTSLSFDVTANALVAEIALRTYAGASTSVPLLL